MAQWAPLSYNQKRCVGSAGKLMKELSMLRPHARIGVAVSGGVDSWTLLQVLRFRQRIVPFPFELMVLHVNPGFDPTHHLPILEWATTHGLAAHVELADHGPRAHSPENRKNSACFFCCRLRRKRLFDLMRHYRLTHLAMGHTADDLVTTFFLNLLHGGTLESMSPRESFFNGEFELIRPLLWLDKATILKAARGWELPVMENPCPSSTTSRRAQIMRWLEATWKSDKRIRSNIYNALRRSLAP